MDIRGLERGGLGRGGKKYCVLLTASSNNNRPERAWGTGEEARGCESGGKRTRRAQGRIARCKPPPAVTKPGTTDTQPNFGSMRLLFLPAAHTPTLEVGRGLVLRTCKREDKIVAQGSNAERHAMVMLPGVRWVVRGRVPGEGGKSGEVGEWDCGVMWGARRVVAVAY